jgi:hypothetical protein
MGVLDRLLLFQAHLLHTLVEAVVVQAREEQQERAAQVAVGTDQQAVQSQLLEPLIQAVVEVGVDIQHPQRAQAAQAAQA